jgi:hypothetical protein
MALLAYLHLLRRIWLIMNSPASLQPTIFRVRLQRRAPLILSKNLSLYWRLKKNYSQFGKINYRRELLMQLLFLRNWTTNKGNAGAQQTLAKTRATLMQPKVLMKVNNSHKLSALVYQRDQLIHSIERKAQANVIFLLGRASLFIKIYTNNQAITLTGTWINSAPKKFKVKDCTYKIHTTIIMHSKCENIKDQANIYNGLTIYKNEDHLIII